MDPTKVKQLSQKEWLEKTHAAEKRSIRNQIRRLEAKLEELEQEEARGSDRAKEAKRRLLAQTRDTNCRVWQVLGEDPNADMGGPHIQPSLGYYEGTYEDVVEHAVGLPGFFSWGAGGDVRPVAMKPIKVKKSK